MAIPSSQTIRSESQMVPELRPIIVSELSPVMPFDLFMAAIEGDSDVLIPRLGLQCEEPTETQSLFAKHENCKIQEDMLAAEKKQATIETSHSASEQIKTEHQTVQLQSATSFGDTVLHLLVTKGHNQLALMVFQRERSLMNAHNKMSETPLHRAAKFGNGEFIDDLIRIDPVIVKDAIKEIDENGDTPMHVAIKHGHVYVGCVLMRLDPEVALRVNKEMLCPLYIAIVKKYRKLVETMLEFVPTLACIPFPDGMFPVHVSARTGNIELVIHFMEKYPNYAELQDSCGRNLFHIAAEENHKKIFTYLLFGCLGLRDMVVRMNNATDNEGNTPLHIAAMKGHTSIMKAIWEKRRYINAERIQNNEGLTPFGLSARQLVETKEDIDDQDIDSYESVQGSKFTEEWFDNIMNPAAENNKWEKIQVLGLGSVLITTVTFAAAFTVPGGYNQDNGTPVLGRRYMFRAFILANTMAFIQGFLSLFVLLFHPRDKFAYRLNIAKFLFMLAAGSMVMAFGLGMYGTLAPVCHRIAMIVLVITLFIGSPFGLTFSTFLAPKIMKYLHSSQKSRLQSFIFGLVIFTMPLLLTFCLALP